MSDKKALLAVCSALYFLSLPVQAGERSTVFMHANVVDGTGGGVSPDTCVMVTGGVISELAACEGFRIPPGSAIVDLTDKFLLPGFIDTHVHAAWGPLELDTSSQPPRMSLAYDAQISHQILGLLPGFGITTIRNPGGPTEESIALREAVAEREVFGPEIVTAGAVIDQFESPGLVVPAPTEEQVRTAVEEQAIAGVDMIKLYAGLTPDLVNAAIDEARKHDLSVIGHLMLTDWRQASELGIDAIVHALPSSPSLLPQAQRASYVQTFTGTQFLYQWFLHADLESAEVHGAISAMAENRVYFDPTLVAVEGMFFGNDPRIAANPSLAHMPQRVRDDWNSEAGLTSAWSEADFAAAQTAWPKVLDLVKRMHDAGVLLTAGTDTVNPNVAAGDGFHAELEHLVDAGIPANEVIRIATLNGAISIGREADLGTVEPGKQADLVILSANPLEDIRNTRSIVDVYIDGASVNDARGDRK